MTSRPGASKTWEGEDQFWQQAKEKGFEVPLASGSAIGSRWTRLMKNAVGESADPAAKNIIEEYSLIKGPHITGKRAAFRKSWAEGEYKTYMVNGHTQSESHPSPVSFHRILGAAPSSQHRGRPSVRAVVCAHARVLPQAKRVQKEEESRTDWLQGTFLSIGRIAHLEGGGPLGWRA